MSRLRVCAENAMHVSNRESAVANRECYPLSRAATTVTRGKDAWQAGLELIWEAILLPGVALGGRATGYNEAFPVTAYLGWEKTSTRLRANKNEQTRRSFSRDVAFGILQPHRLDALLSLNGNYFGAITDCDPRVRLYPLR